jgi:hypothetical protein
MTPIKNKAFTVLTFMAVALIGAAFGILITKPEPKPPVNPAEYQFVVTDDSVTVYDVNRIVGTIKLEGQLDSLITLDNQ